MVVVVSKLAAQVRQVVGTRLQRPTMISTDGGPRVVQRGSLSAAWTPVAPGTPFSCFLLSTVVWKVSSLLLAGRIHSWSTRSLEDHPPFLPFQKQAQAQLWLTAARLRYCSCYIVLIDGQREGRTSKGALIVQRLRF